MSYFDVEDVPVFRPIKFSKQFIVICEVLGFGFHDKVSCDVYTKAAVRTMAWSS